MSNTKWGRRTRSDNRPYPKGSVSIPNKGGYDKVDPPTKALPVASYRYRYIHNYFSEYTKRKGIKPTPENFKIYLDGLLRLEKQGKIEMSKASGTRRENQARQTGTLKITRMIEKFYRDNKDYHKYFMLRDKRSNDEQHKMG